MVVGFTYPALSEGWFRAKGRNMRGISSMIRSNIEFQLQMPQRIMRETEAEKLYDWTL